MKKTWHFFKRIFSLCGIVCAIIFLISFVFYLSCVNSSFELDEYALSSRELMRIKIYGSSYSKEGDSVSGTFSIIDSNGSEIAVVERSWKALYLGVEFCKINIRKNVFVFPIKIYGRNRIFDGKNEKAERRNGTDLQKYYIENGQCLLLGNAEPYSKKNALYRVSLLSKKLFPFSHFRFAEYFFVDLSECKTNQFYSISCDEKGNIFINEL